MLICQLSINLFVSNYSYPCQSLLYSLVLYNMFSVMLLYMFCVEYRFDHKDTRIQSQFLFFVENLFFLQKYYYLKKRLFQNLNFKQTTGFSLCSLCTVN